LASTELWAEIPWSNEEKNGELREEPGFEKAAVVVSAIGHVKILSKQDERLKVEGIHCCGCEEGIGQPVWKAGFLFATKREKEKEIECANGDPEAIGT
jgi:hypothetical protein